MNQLLSLKPFYILAVIVFCLILNSQISLAQNNGNISDSTVKKFEYYSAKTQPGFLFAHFDKTIYTNNENVWFTAYQLNDNVSKNDVLSAVLVKDDDHSMVLQEKFVMENGIAFGNFFLPDSIKSGNYSFMLYVNTVIGGKPVDIFIQPVTVKNTTETSFTASLTIMDTSEFPIGGIRKILLMTSPKGPKLISGANVRYFVGNKSHPATGGIVKTDKTGQFLLNIPTNNLTVGNNLLHVEVSYNKESQSLKLLLPVHHDKLSVKFYPEGGNLADGLLSNIGWEVKTVAGSPIKTSGILYKNDKPTDTVTTNSYGMGHFKLVPQKDSRYYIKLFSSESKDSIYFLPPVLTDFPVITITHALANDTLIATIKSRSPATYYILIHNYRQLFYSLPIHVNAKGIILKINLAEIPKGIVMITALDSLQRPCAERLFFSHFNRHNSLIISTDLDEYKTRQKVNLNLKLSGQDGRSTPGLVSIACIQANRLEIKKTINIDSYFYLNHNLGTLPEKENYLGNSSDDLSFLEYVLLIKGWRRYTWAEVTKTLPADTLQRQDTLSFTGTVTYLNKPLKKPATLIIRKDSMISTAKTDVKGQFALTNNQLFMRGDKKVYLYISGRSTEDYNIKVGDPYEDINSHLAKSFEPVDYDSWATNQKNTESLTGFEHAIQLKEVKIKGTNDHSLYNVNATNACGDYVCRYNILNCPNHRNESDNKLPIKGETYRTYDYTKGALSPIVYSGCYIPERRDNIMLKIRGIYYPMEFYQSDYSQFSPSQPEYLSTIYWKYLSQVSSDSELNLSFFTSDITGDFKIIVQGVSENDVLYGEKTFQVRKP